MLYTYATDLAHACLSIAELCIYGGLKILCGGSSDAEYRVCGFFFLSNAYEGECLPSIKAS